MSCATSLVLRPFRKLAPGLHPWEGEDLPSSPTEGFAPLEEFAPLPRDIWLSTELGAECLLSFAEHRRANGDTLH